MLDIQTLPLVEVVRPQVVVGRLLERTVSAEAKGIMEQIREHLAQGKSSGEVIALGYKPGTVYKVQRWLNRKGRSDAIALRQTGALAPVSSVDPQVLGALRAKNAELEQWQTRTGSSSMRPKSSGRRKRSPLRSG